MADVRTAVDAAAVATTALTLLDYAPKIAAVVTTVWTIMRICEMVPRWLASYRRWRDGKRRDVPS